MSARNGSHKKTFMAKRKVNLSKNSYMDEVVEQPGRIRRPKTNETGKRKNRKGGQMGALTYGMPPLGNQAKALSNR